LRRVRRRADDAAAEFGLAASDRYEFVFAVNEAVTNAIKHGRPDRDGTIGLQIVADGDTLICSISDSGQFQLGPHGPDPDGPDRDGPDPLGESGRGLACISRLMDRIELSTAPHGTTLRLHKRRRGNHAEHAA
jgi:anti-sigma regulatory factor (Ser/Thr protein kinase)